MTLASGRSLAHFQVSALPHCRHKHVKRTMEQKLDAFRKSAVCRRVHIMCAGHLLPGGMSIVIKTRCC